MRYHEVSTPAVRDQYRRLATGIFVEGRSKTLEAARNELSRGLNGLLGNKTPVIKSIFGDGGVVAGTPKSSPAIERLGLQERLHRLGGDMTLPVGAIARLYRCRWQVELFFKWIKQHLRIKEFFGTSPNTVKTQIWIAITIYALVAIFKKRLGLERSLYSILRILSVTLFEKDHFTGTFTGYCQRTGR